MSKDSERDLIGEEHGDDSLIVAKVSVFEHVREQFKERFLVKSANIISEVPGCERQGDVLIGWHLELDGRCVRFWLDKSGTGQAKSAVTAGSKEAMATAEIAEIKCASI